MGPEWQNWRNCAALYVLRVATVDHHCWIYSHPLLTCAIPIKQSYAHTFQIVRSVIVGSLENHREGIRPWERRERYRFSIACKLYN